MRVNTLPLSSSKIAGRNLAVPSKRLERCRPLDQVTFGPEPRVGAVKGVPKVVLLIESARAAGRALLCGIARYAHHHGPWSFYWEVGGLENFSGSLGNLDA